LLLKDHLDADSFTPKDGLTDATVHTMLEDREGNVWITTVGGVERFRPTNVHSLPPEVAAGGGHALAPAENLWQRNVHLSASKSSESCWDVMLQRNQKQQTAVVS
jgi:ligand-binding sensor domain-containing protein